MKITINGGMVEARPGQTVLQVAREVGIEIPTLCYLEGIEPRTSCFLCVVRVEGRHALQPACVVPAEEGLSVTTDSEEVLEARRTALELLFSDHAGRCVAPCVMACPADLDIPRFLKHLKKGERDEASRILRRQLVLPGVLGRVCKGYCQSACYRGRVDETIAIRLLHGHLGKAEREAFPDAAASSGKRAAVVGAGPAGLAAAFSLRLSGHECVLFDQSHEAGGLMRSMPGDLIEPEAVDSEIECLMAGGGHFRPGWQLGRDGSLEDLRGEYDAVVLALGAGVDFPGEGRRPDLSFAKSLGLGVTEKGVEMDRRSQATTLPGVFVAGEFVTGAANVVRSVASGKAAAFSADQFLRGNEVTGQPRPFCFSNRVNGVEDQISALKSLHELPDAGGSETHTLQGDPGQVSLRDCADEALRCLQCSCAEETTCRLRHYGGEYGIDPYRYEGESRRQAPDVAHPEIIYEPGKCILCGLCLNVAEAEGENIGLAFSGRGFPTRVTVPLGADLPAGLRRAARKCAEACPTAALHIRER